MTYRMNNWFAGWRSVGRWLLGMVVITILASFQVSPVMAASVESLKLLSDTSGQRLRISMDQASEYQVFNLEGPKRLVLNFPAASMAKSIHSLQGDGAVSNIVPTQDSGGVRIEIALTAGTTYDISEKGKDLLVSFSAVASRQAVAKGAVLQDIEVRDNGSVTELVLRGRHLDVNHNAMVTNGGKTMVLDFWGGKSDLPKEYYSYTSRRLNHIAIGVAEKRVRLVVSLRSGVGGMHQIDAAPNEMVVRFGPLKKAAHSGSVVVESVDFQPEDRIAHLVIRTDKTDPVINLKEENGKVILDMKQARLADGQERTQDVRAFPGPVKQIDSYSMNKNVRIVARLRQKSVVTSYQSGNVLTVTMKPADMVSAQADGDAARGEKVYSGQKVSFEYKDIDIRNALKLIAEMSNLNMIMSDDVTGVLTMRLVDVPWDQALDLILTSKGLGKEQNGNVIRIAPLEVLRVDANARKEAKKSAEDIAPLETEFITLGYASIDDVKAILEEGAQSNESATPDSTSSSVPNNPGDGFKLKSERGSILYDKRSNTIIVTDTHERLNNIKRLIAVIDKPMKQVLIEARIVEASDSFSRDIGVKWGGTYNDQGAGRFTHKLNGASVGQNVVDLGAAVGAGAGGAIGYTLGTLSGALNLNLELSAAETEGEIKVVSSPRIFTSNLKTAKIDQTRNLFFSQTQDTGNSTTTGTNTKDPISIPLTLEVTPQITADGRVIMALKIEKGTPVVEAGADATVDTKSLETNLLVKSGETVVLGGIYSKTTTSKISGVPFLQDIPLFGLLFKRNEKTDNRNELLIFITPTVVDETLSQKL
ncbi:MAG: type IV pilus secretin PilQ [Mariprofundus sp.]